MSNEPLRDMTKRERANTSGVAYRKSIVDQEEIINGTHKITDDRVFSCCQRGREIEAVGDAHSYTEQELQKLASFESIEYLPPNNEVYREYLKSSRPPSVTMRWVAMGFIGVSVGMVGFLNKIITEYLNGWRRKYLFERLLNESVPEECSEDSDIKFTAENYACGYVSYEGLLFPIFAGIGICFACIAAAVVVLIQPAAASSGIPEVIAFLNGTLQRKIFNVRTLAIKFVSCIFAVSSGLPVGPEGPMIHMGAMIGRGVSQMRSKTIGFKLPLFEHFRNAKDSRDFITAGAAAGVSSAFGAPVGGLLFALEEVASTWSQTLTWQIFFCSMCATTTTVIFVSAFGGFKYSPPFGQLHAGGERSSIEFYIAEGINVNILLFIPTILIGVTCGVMGSLFTFINLKMATFRRNYINKHWWLRIVEPMLIMVLFAALTILFSLGWGCTDAKYAHPDNIKDGTLVRLTCPVGSYNEVATLMLTSGHNAIVLLFTRHEEETGVGREMFSGGSVVLLLLAYFPLAAISAGSAISSGLVVPMLLIGSCIGRLWGILCLAIVPSGPLNVNGGCPSDPAIGDDVAAQCWFVYVDPGAFALVGAAAFFGGVSRLTIALTIIMIEITNDVRFILPIMLGVMSAKWVADSITHSLYHALIEAKCLPFLNPEVTLHGVADGELEKHSIQDLVGDHMSVRTLGAGDIETFKSCAECLMDSTHGCFPLIDGDDHFVGTITRAHLTAVVVSAANGNANRVLTHEELLESELIAAEDIDHALEKCHADAVIGAAKADLKPYANTSANKVVGILTRKDLMDYRLHDVIHPHVHHH